MKYQLSFANSLSLSVDRADMHRQISGRKLGKPASLQKSIRSYLTIGHQLAKHTKLGRGKPHRIAEKICLALIFVYS